MSDALRLQVRQSHVISNAAVGALVQIGGLSLVPCDIRDWGKDGEAVDMPRLKRLLDVSLRKAPVVEKHGDYDVGGRIPVVRFPRWMYCPQCRTMRYVDAWGGGDKGDRLLCPEAECRAKKPALAPMPWVAICANGHMDDVDWFSLVHRDGWDQRQKTCRDHDHLLFVTAGGRGHPLRVECGSCHAMFAVAGLRAKDLLSKDKCRGLQPWLRRGEDCDQRLEVAGLGDHFVHYPVAVSALDIPPESRWNPQTHVDRRIRNHELWHSLLEMHDRHGSGNHVVKQKVAAIANGLGCDPDEIWQRLAAPTQAEPPLVGENAPIHESALLRVEEYRALRNPIADYREYERFITVSRTAEWRTWIEGGEAPPRGTAPGWHIAELIGVTRLREVRALKGFSRINLSVPGGGEVRVVPVDLEGKSPWLPAAEFYGEGVFFVLDRDHLWRWNLVEAVQKRARIARKGFEASSWSKRLGIDAGSLPAFIALHTLSHLLIREMAFECGYPAASLRERIYFSDDDTGMAGALIYLAAGEPGGSLGGIARLAEPDRFAALLARGVEKAMWCTLDPVCGEHEGRSESRLNRAACHACCLVAETSCECGNLMLDRKLVVSTPGDVGVGLFDPAH